MQGDNILPVDYTGSVYGILYLKGLKPIDRSNVGDFDFDFDFDFFFKKKRN